MANKNGQKEVMDIKLGTDEVDRWMNKLKDVKEGMERCDLEYDGGKLIIHRKD
jgi:hypothetical protein